MTPEQVQHLRKLEASASYAPWPDLPHVWADQAKYHNPHARIMLNSMSSWAVGPQCTSHMQAKHDAELISAIRNALPELLDDWEQMYAERLTALHGGLKRLRKEIESTILDDGVGNTWAKCQRADCGLQIVRPGKVQCSRCEEEDQEEVGE